MLALKRNKKAIEFTEGKILGKMIVFILPIIVTNFLQMFYNIADTVIVSLSAEKDAVGAVGITSPLLGFILNFITGTTVGINVVVAKYLGSKNDEDVSKSIHTSFMFMLILGGLATVLGLSFSKPILVLMGGREEFLELAVRYTRVYFLGTPFVALVNWGAAILRANGDNQTALKILSFSGITNVVLNLVFVLFLKMSVEGVAIATVVSNVVSFFFIFRHLLKQEGALKFSFKKIKIHKDVLFRILRIGVPAALEGMVISTSDMMVQSALIRVNNLMTPIGSAFQPVIKGSVAHSSLEGFIGTCTGSVATAIVVFVAQNSGAEKYDRVKRTINIGYLLMLMFTVVPVVLLTILRKPLLSLYDVVPGVEGSLEQIAYQTAMTKIKIVWIPFFIISSASVGSGALRGMGYSMLVTIINLSGVVAFRIIWINTVFNAYPTLEILLLCYPLSSLLMSIAFFISGRIKIKKQQRLL